METGRRKPANQIHPNWKAVLPKIVSKTVMTKRPKVTKLDRQKKLKFKPPLASFLAQLFKTSPHNLEF